MMRLPALILLATAAAGAYPTASPLTQANAALQAGEDNSLWEFEEAHYCKPDEHPT